MKNNVFIYEIKKKYIGIRYICQFNDAIKCGTNWDRYYKLLKYIVCVTIHYLYVHWSLYYRCTIVYYIN